MRNLRTRELIKKLEKEAEQQNRETLNSHKTMEDDIYRKRYNDLNHKKGNKIPSWVSFLFYFLVFAVFLGIFIK